MLLAILVVASNFASASDAPFNHRYQGPSDRSSVSYYYDDYNAYYDGGINYDYYAGKPIFKGSFGNYRYQMYANGDYSPSNFFVDYPEYGVRPYFSGGSGFGNYGGYGGYYNYYPSYYGSYNYYPIYSYNEYGYNYYPSYSYGYAGCSFGC